MGFGFFVSLDVLDHLVLSDPPVSSLSSAFEASCLLPAQCSITNSTVAAVDTIMLDFLMKLIWISVI